VSLLRSASRAFAFAAPGYMVPLRSVSFAAACLFALVTVPVAQQLSPEATTEVALVTHETCELEWQTEPLC
jgi:hypothetical protein